MSGAQLKAGPTSGSTLVLVGNAGTANAIAVEGSAFRKDGSPVFGFSEGSDAAGNESNPVGESINATFLAYDSLGIPLEVDVTLVLEATSNAGTVWRFIAASPDDTDYQEFNPAGPGQILGTGTVEFDTEGRLVNTNNGTIVISREATGADQTVDINLDFARVTALANDRSELFVQQDGSRIGTLVGFSIGNNGVITGAFDNGLTSTLGQVALATFDNPQGLLDNGSSLYSVGANSGEPRIGGPLDGLAGSIRSGALELSNVDLSSEFINLIIASTGFSASSRIITTSDQLMTELLNTSRR